MCRDDYLWYKLYKNMIFLKMCKCYQSYAVIRRTEKSKMCRSCENTD